MAGIKISALPIIVTPAITDIFAVVQAGVTYQESGAQFSTLFLPLTGGTLTGNLILNGNPTVANQAANKAYVDAIAQGITVQGACRLGSTGALTVVYANGVLGVGATLTNAGAMAALTLDGIAVAVNDRVLIKNQASTFQNGIYTVTAIGSGVANWVLTRATDYDQVAEVNPGDLVVVTAGATLTNSGWLQTATVVTMGTSAITFVQFSASLPISVANGGTGLTSTTINQILYSSAANTIAGLATANNGLLVTSAAGVPSILAGPGTTGRALLSNAAAAPSFSTVPYPSAAGWTSFTPTLVSAGTLPTFSAISLGRYQQVGNVVFMEVCLNNSAAGTAGAGANDITINLPVTSGATQSLAITICGDYINGVACNALGVQVASNGATVASLFKGMTGGATRSNLQCADLNDANNREITFKFFYEI